MACGGPARVPRKGPSEPCHRSLSWESSLRGASVPWLCEMEASGTVKIADSCK